MPSTQGSAAYDTLLYKYKRNTVKSADHTQEHGAPAAVHTSSKVIRLRRVNKTSLLPKSGKAFHSFNPSQVRLMISGGLALAVLGVFFVANINYEVRKNELSTLIAEREAELQTLRNDYDGLMVEYDRKMSDSSIQEYAEKELGMQKRGNFQLKWISVGEENDFENDDSMDNGFIDWLASYFA